MTHLLMDKTRANRVAGPSASMSVPAISTYSREGRDRVCGRCIAYLQASRRWRRHGKDMVCTVEQRLRVALPILVGAKMTQMENRIVLTRFKTVMARSAPTFLHLKTYTENAYGTNTINVAEHTRELVGDYVDRHRADLSAQPCPVGGGQGRPSPIRMVTKEAFQDPHKETVGWENFLGMTIGQAVVWASQNIDPKHTNPELTTSEPYVMGSHASCSGAWASGPEDCAPSDYQWGYNRMMTVDGLFGAGDTIGGAAHKFSSGILWRKAGSPPRRQSTT